MEKSQTYWSFEAQMEALAREFGREFTFDDDAVDEIVRAMRAWWSANKGDVS